MRSLFLSVSPFTPHLLSVNPQSACLYQRRLHILLHLRASLRAMDYAFFAPPTNQPYQLFSLPDKSPHTYSPNPGISQDSLVSNKRDVMPRLSPKLESDISPRILTRSRTPHTPFSTKIPTSMPHPSFHKPTHQRSNCQSHMAANSPSHSIERPASSTRGRMRAS